MTDADDLLAVRSAARAYAEMHGLAGASSIDAPPLLGPVRFERDGRSMVAYRWLGSGRGGDYVQVDVDAESGAIVVHGARGDTGLPEWKPENESDEPAEPADGC